MPRLSTLSLLLGGAATALALAVTPARAHCDSIDGPVATAARGALEAGNVNLVLPYAPASAESEMTSAFRQAAAVRKAGGEAQALADRYFMETAVRLHRAGEHAPYEGLKPAGIDHGPAIPAAEQAIASGNVAPLLATLSEATQHGIETRFAHVRHSMQLPARPQTTADVPAARERVKAELDFVTYAHGVYAATAGGAHAE